MKKLLFSAMIVIIALSIASPVGATQVFRWLHHESQGLGDPSYTKCMPEAAWHGHKHHEGDWQGEICIPDDGDDGDGEDGGNGGDHNGNGGKGGQPAEVVSPSNASILFNWVESSAGQALGGTFEGEELGGGGYWTCKTEPGWQYCVANGNMSFTGPDGTWVVIYFTPTGGSRVRLIVDEAVNCDDHGIPLPADTCFSIRALENKSAEVALPNESYLIH